MSILDDLQVRVPENYSLPARINEEIECELPVENRDQVLEFSVSFPLKRISHYWHPTSDEVYSLPNLWDEPLVLGTNYSLPLFSFLDESGENRLTIALNETIRKVIVQIGIHEESAAVIATFTFPEGISQNRLKLTFDGIARPFYQSIVAGREWIYRQGTYQEMPQQPAAFLPVYSTWYSFHQSLSQVGVEAQSSQFTKYHLQTLILDDGWQTDDNSRRYAYAGDWEIAKSKFPSMKAHIAKMQQAKIKYLVWVTLPYVGEKTSAYAQFKDQLLYFDAYQKAGILDPRYPDVRDYLVQKLVALVRELHLDGLKIDFVDAFREVELQSSAAMDTKNLEESINILLQEIVTKCRELNPDFLIEFRENYFGPNMVQYSNIIRVKDCPNNFNKNRIGLTNIRLLAPSVAPHSDMILFHLADELPAICLQFLSCLYGVVQLSVDLTKLSPAQQQMIAFWLAYQDRNRDILLKQEFAAFNPQLGYNLLAAGSKAKRIITSYQANQMLQLDELIAKDFDLINASLVDGLFVASDDLIGRSYHYEIFDLSGNQIQEGDLAWQEWQRLPVPACGLMQLKAN